VGLCSLWYGPRSERHEHGSEFSGFVQRDEFYDCLNDRWVPKNGSASWSSMHYFVELQLCLLLMVADGR
jgi:hypothetical protein